MANPKRKRIIKGTKVPLPPSNDGTNTPVPDHNSPAVLDESEAALFKQAKNPLGDPHKV
jgi:hypothetical protein